MKTLCLSLMGCALFVAGCDDQPQDFCIQYVNGTDLSLAMDVVDNKNVKIHNASLAPVDPNIGPIASPIFGVTGFSPITVTAPFALSGGCVIPVASGRHYILQVASNGEFICYDDGTGRCEPDARRKPTARTFDLSWLPPAQGPQPAE